jgi:hypothetical protein
LKPTVIKRRTEAIGFYTMGATDRGLIQQNRSRHSLD